MPAAGRQSVPIEQKNVQILDIEIIDARADALRYRATLRKRDRGEVPDCAAGDCEPALTGATAR
jgi:hypothetical protein